MLNETPSIGHNSSANVPMIIDADNKHKSQNREPRDSNATAQLRSYIERIIRLEEQKKDIGADIAEIYTEAAGNGFGKNALKLVVKQKLKPADVAVLAEANFYLESIGDLPLFAYAS